MRMKNVKKRVLSILMCAVLTLSMMLPGFPQTVLATEGFADGDGTEGDPWIIETSKQLATEGFADGDETEGDPWIIETSKQLVTEGFADGDETESDPWIIETSKQLMTEGFADGDETEGDPWIIGTVKQLMTEGFTDGDGTSENPYIIETAAQLDAVRNNLTAHYKLAGDIDLIEYLSDGCAGFEKWEASGWEPIGTSTSGSQFTGSFDGAEHKIIGIWINRTTDYVGLFGYIGTNGSVSDLGVEESADGIKGDQYVGGVAGQNEGTIQNCYNTSAVTGNGSARYVGGVAGQNEGTIQNCYNTGAVNGSAYVGGVTGNNTGTIQNCYNTGAATGTSSNVGGIAGFNYGGTIQNCYNTGAVTGSGTYVGGVAGRNTGAITNYYYNTDNYNGNAIGYGGNRNGGLTTEEMTADNVLSGAMSGLDSAFVKPNHSSTAGCVPAYYPELKIFAESTDKNTAEMSKASVLAAGLYSCSPDAHEEIFHQGSGTEDDPYQITSAAQLSHVCTHLEASFVLTDDIDLSDYLSDGGLGYAIWGVSGWKPIGNNSSQFTGSFDGAGHKITGLWINRTDYYTGLFGFVDSGAAVQNLGVVNADITGYYYVGGVVGYISSGTVQNCYATGSVTATGGVTGTNEASRYVGGVAGYVSSGTVQNCYATSSVTGIYNVGGVVGEINNSTVQNCYATGSVVGTSNVGGVVGYVNGTVQNCYATGSVRGTNNNVGGVAGYVYNGTVKNCAALNPTVSGTLYVGRVIGYNSSGTITNNYAYNGVNCVSNGTAYHNGTDISAAEIAADGTLGLFIDTDIWMTENGSLPGLFGATVEMPAHICNLFLGAGTLNEPYLISTAAELAKLAELVNAGTAPYANANIYYKLTADIDLSAYGKDWNDSKGWIPIGTFGNPFKGQFDGANHTISALYINRTGNYTGLFGYVANGAMMQNLGVANTDVTGTSYVGGVVGWINNGTAQNCYATGSVSGTSYVGGVAGDVGSATVQNCYATGSVSGTGNYVGGVAGDVSGTVQNCYATGSVSGTSYVGGIAGRGMGGATVRNCAALNPTVSGTTNVGRIIGYNSSGTITNNYAFSGMTCVSNGTACHNGISITVVDIAISSFWTTGGNWNGSSGWSSSVWTFEKNMLPGLFGAAIPMPAHLHAFDGGNGTSTNPYEISTAAQLAWLAERVNVGTAPYANANIYYKLTANIDLSTYGGEWNNGKGWIPIGYTGNTPFKGQFDGDNHTISGLYINRTDDYTGLFGYVYSGAVVQNLGVADANVTGQRYVSGVAGYLYGATVQNCYVTGSVTGGYEVGGIAGGVYFYSMVQNCYTTASVKGTFAVGGVVGVDNGTVQNCYATASVTGNYNVGGVAGEVFGGTVQNCATLNPTVSGTVNVGRVVGYVTNSIVENNYAFSGMSCVSNGTACHNGISITVVDIAISSFWTTGGNWNGGSGWSSSVWTFEKNKLPGLFGAAIPIPAHLHAFDGGNGTSTNPYEISTAAQLAWLTERVNAGTAPYANANIYYKLTANIDLSAYGGEWNNGKGWIPIGYTGNNPFKGQFDGDNHTISGLYINRTDDYTGLFGYVASSAMVQNLGVMNADVSGTAYVGGVAGYVYNGTVQNCYVTGSVSGTDYVGGVAGYVNGSTVQNCYVTGSVSGNDRVGGVAGYVNGTVQNCYATGGVSGEYGVGGVVGSVYNGTVKNCAALNPTVSGASTVGRVVGNNGGGIIRNNYAFSGMTCDSRGSNYNNGTDITAVNIAISSFWTTGGNWLDGGSGWSSSVWTFENNKLPGLFGAAVEMPVHLLVPDPLISVTVEWGAMEFTYSEGTWNPETHVYDGAGWTCDDDDNRIRVTNNGEQTLSITFSYEKEINYKALSGSFVDAGNTPISNNTLTLTDGSETPQLAKVYLLITGTLKAATLNKEKIGTVTVTIEEVTSP